MEKRLFNKDTLKRIFTWSYIGIQVWQFLTSLSISSFLSILVNNVRDWVWYETAYFFISTFMIVLGIFIYTRLHKLTRITNYKTLLELSDFYNGQKNYWKNYIRLRLINVKLHVTADVPYVILTLELINYLPVKIKLVKVAHSSGLVSSAELGSCKLCTLPETIEEQVSPCSEKTFEISLDVHGTKLPAFLNNTEVLRPGRKLQWTLRGEWYIEAYGKIELWQSQSYGIIYDQFISDTDALS